MNRAVSRCKLPIALKLPKLKNSDQGRILARMNPNTSLNLGIFVVILELDSGECVRVLNCIKANGELLLTCLM